MANLSVLYPRLQTEALGAPPALMDLKIRDAARMFMKEAPAYQAGHADIAIIPQTGTYALTVPTDAEIVRVLRVNFLATTATRARPVLPVPEAGLIPDWETREGGIKHFMTPDLNILTLVPKPDVNVTGDLQNIHLQLRPSRSAATIPDAVLDRWEEDIMVGAVFNPFFLLFSLIGVLFIPICLITVSMLDDVFCCMLYIAISNKWLFCITYHCYISSLTVRGFNSRFVQFK